jgi:hypothetical protein
MMMQRQEQYLSLYVDARFSRDALSPGRDAIDALSPGDIPI